MKREPSADKRPHETPRSNLKNAAANETATHPWTRERANMYLDMLKDDLDTDGKLLFAYVHETPPLHIRRTLDQSFYYTLSDQDIRDRDLDQVVYRYTNEVMTSPRILMVDQLWLWIIDEPGQPSNSHVLQDFSISLTLIGSYSCNRISSKMGKYSEGFGKDYSGTERNRANSGYRFAT
jgi:hypothetical protein